MTASCLRAAVQALPDYAQADLSNGDARLLVNRNEAACAPPASVLEAIRALDASSLRRYPVDLLDRLADGLALRAGCAAPQLAIGNGADDVLGAIGRATLDAGDRVVTMTPSFGMYARIAATSGALPVRVPYARRWQFDAEAFIRNARGAKLAILGHPNNPTGDALDAATLGEIARALPQTLIVVDEVYLALGRRSLAAAVFQRSNVAVVGSLSKVAALAGLRVGYAIAQPEVAAALRRVMPPFPIGVASLVAADAYVRGGAETAAFEAALEAQVRRSLDTIVAEIGSFAREVWRSCGNFVLMDFGDAGAPLAGALRARGIAVRAFDDPQLDGCIRFCALDDESTAELVAAVRGAAATLGMRGAYA